MSFGFAPPEEEVQKVLTDAQFFGLIGGVVGFAVGIFLLVTITVNTFAHALSFRCDRFETDNFTVTICSKESDGVTAYSFLDLKSGQRFGPTE